MGRSTVERDGVSVSHAVPVRARRHDEPRGGRPPAPAARPVRAQRGRPRPARPGSCGSRWSAGGWPTTPTRPASPRRTRTPSARSPSGSSRRRRCCRTSGSTTRPCWTSPGSARRSRSTACAPTSSPPAPRSRTPPGAAAPTSPATTYARRPGSRSRTAAVGPRSTTPTRTTARSTRRCRRTSPTILRWPGRAGRRQTPRRHATGPQDDAPPDAPASRTRRHGRRRQHADGHRLRRGVPRAAAHRAGHRRRRRRPPLPGAHLDRADGRRDAAPGRPGAPARDDPRRRPAPGPDQVRRPAARGARGPRVEPRADVRGRVRLDGRAAPDGAGEGRGAVAAARRLPAPRQGRADHLPRHRRARRAPADRRRWTWPPGASTPCRPAGAPRSPRVSPRRPAPSSASGSRTPVGGRCSSW